MKLRITYCLLAIRAEGWYEDFRIHGNIINGFIPNNSLPIGGAPGSPTQVGIQCAGLVGASIRGNKIYNTQQGISLNDCYTLDSDDNVYGISISQNDIQGNVSGLFMLGLNQLFQLNCNTFNLSAGFNINNWSRILSADNQPEIGKLEEGVVNYFLSPNKAGDIINQGGNPVTPFFYYHKRGPGNGNSLCSQSDIRPLAPNCNGNGCNYVAFINNVRVTQSNDQCNPNACRSTGGGGINIGGIITQLNGTTNPGERGKLIRQIVQAYRDNDQSAMPFLAQLNDPAFKKSQIPMLIGQGQYALAQTAINELPYSTSEEIDVKDYLQILLDLAVAGKRIPEAAPAVVARVKQIAMEQTKSVRFPARAFIHQALDTLIEDEMQFSNIGGRYYNSDELLGGGAYISKMNCL